MNGGPDRGPDWTGSPLLMPRAGAPPDPRIRARRGELLIGRDRNCDIVVVESTISRRHARLVWDGETLTLEDLGSSVGTYVNDERIQRQTLQLGDRVRLGHAEYEVGLETSSTQPLELAFLRSRPDESVRQLQTLLEVSRALSKATELDQVLEIVLETASRLLEVDRARIVLVRADGEPVAFATYPPGQAGNEDAGERSELLRRAIETKTTLVAGGEEGASESMESRGALEAVACPLLVARRPIGGGREASFIGRVDVLGGILLERTTEARGFERPHLAVLETLAADAASAIDGAMLYRESRDKAKIEHEMELARTIQAALLQAPPPVPFAESFALFSPASSVGGDLYHGALRSDGRLALVLGDVSGKGMGASLWMALTVGLLGLLHDLAHPLDALLPELNRSMRRFNPNNRFLTMAALLLAPDGSAAFASAGHCPAVLLRKGKEPELLASTGPVVGLLPIGQWQAIPLRLEPGDRVVFYSDGVTESESPEGVEFDVAGVVRALRETGDAGPEETGRALVAAARRHRQGGEASDDITLLAVRYLGNDAPTAAAS